MTERAAAVRFGAIEATLAQIYPDGADIESRKVVAAAFGYADSRMLVFLRETYGMPLSLAAKKVTEHGLKVDFHGLRTELERMGKKPDTIESELNEVRFVLGELM